MPRQSTLPLRYSVRIDSGSREGVWTPSKTGDVIGGDHVSFLLTRSFPPPSYFFFPVVKLVSHGVIHGPVWLKFLHRVLFWVF